MRVRFLHICPHLLESELLEEVDALNKGSGVGEKWIDYRDSQFLKGDELAEGNEKQLEKGE